ncbi:hypothetical protein [Haloactinomyces albus]|uniref:Uncharacterized protein n=1 Tax=Haloactinomyces albus TaxID=1352928 RepID=A0AAE4CLJ8_9ACTN|nr:hypothetical protein [Haloactinomyces albus]MDR7299997.1 hypothetical protein [Haloactinomyces albus]
MLSVEETADWAPEPDELAAIEPALEAPPRLFAICELDRDSDGELLGGFVFAWGLAWPDRAELVGADGSTRGSFRSVQRALEIFARTGEVRLAWPTPAAA